MILSIGVRALRTFRIRFSPVFNTPRLPSTSCMPIFVACVIRDTVWVLPSDLQTAPRVITIVIGQVISRKPTPIIDRHILDDTEYTCQTANDPDLDGISQNLNAVAQDRDRTMAYHRTNSWILSTCRQPRYFCSDIGARICVQRKGS